MSAWTPVDGLSRLLARSFGKMVGRISLRHQPQRVRQAILQILRRQRLPCFTVKKKKKDIASVNVDNISFKLTWSRQGFLWE